MDFYDSSWQDCIENGRSIGAYIIFYQGGPIDHGTHVTGPTNTMDKPMNLYKLCSEYYIIYSPSQLIHDW